jgi:recombination protein RecA
MASDLSRIATTGKKPWPVLDQALRVADLLLQGGGFSVIVLDLGSTAPEVAWRIPLATWFRFRAACERTRVSLILLTQHPCARSSAEVVVRLEGGSIEAESRVMTGVHYQSVVQRSRSHESEARVVPIRKPPQSATAGSWKSEAAWAKAK